VNVVEATGSWPLGKLILKALVRLFRQTGPAADVLDLPLCHLLALNIGLRND
jgi:hypothetical protein